LTNEGIQSSREIVSYVICEEATFPLKCDVCTDTPQPRLAFRQHSKHLLGFLLVAMYQNQVI
jgi:hypothetical protein